jgi:hypothetical protein
VEAVTDVAQEVVVQVVGGVGNACTDKVSQMAWAATLSLVLVLTALPSFASQWHLPSKASLDSIGQECDKQKK